MGGLILLPLGGLGAILMSSKKRQGAAQIARPAGQASAAPIAYQPVAQTSVEPPASFTMTPDKIALYRQSIANTTDPAVLAHLAGTFDMAGLSGLAKEARDRAATLRQSGAAITPEKIAVYRQSIANTTDPAALEQLAGTFDMAGLSDLSKEARDRARLLRAKGSQAQVAGAPASPAPSCKRETRSALPRARPTAQDSPSGSFNPRFTRANRRGVLEAWVYERAGLCRSIGTARRLATAIP